MAAHLHDPNCALCRYGRWRNDVCMFFSGVLFKLCPSLWIKLANREALRIEVKK